MDTHTRAPQEDPVPLQWKTRWYRLRFRFLRHLSYLLAMPRSTDVEQALRHRLWNGIQLGRAQVLGHCPYHPEEKLQEMRRGRFSCFLCETEVYPSPHWMPELAEPRTDPHAVQMPVSPFLAYRLRTHPQASQETQAHRAVNWPKSEKRG